MKTLMLVLTILFGALAVAEHLLLLDWGVVWPLCHLHEYPGDGGVNIFSIIASSLFLGANVGAAVALFPRGQWLTSASVVMLGLPCGIVVTFSLMRLLFLDPVVAYLTLLPGLSAVLLLHWLGSLCPQPRKVLDCVSPAPLC